MKHETQKRNTRYTFVILSAPFVILSAPFVILSASEESGQRTESTWKTASFCHSCKSRNPENQYVESAGGSLKRSLGMALFVKGAKNENEPAKTSFRAEPK